ncbi:MAG: prepilin-type N-terminal cleavage/methylation domain-containing protein [Candidatus Omnitrophica bacterium]|nr:prepilin-type N-terminal cleavage/methylation domain-containing protein [Candidatus Omnitrophota bacterium]
MTAKGFTLIEIMIALTIIALVSLIAVPNITHGIRTAKATACIKNQENIDAACQLWALTTGADSSDVPSINALCPMYIRKWPTCEGKPYVPPAPDSRTVCPNEYPEHNRDATGG